MRISSFQHSRAASASASVYPFIFIIVYLKSSSRHIPQNNEPIYVPYRVFPKCRMITKNAQLPPRPTALLLLRLPCAPPGYLGVTAYHWGFTNVLGGYRGVEGAFLTAKRSSP